MLENFLPPQELAKITIKIGSDAAEIDMILPLVRQAHKESYFADLPFDREQYESLCHLLRDKPGFYGALYAEYEGEPAAFAYYMFRPILGSRKTWITIIHSLYIRSDLRATPVGGYLWNRINLTVKTWSAPRGSKGIMFNVISGVAIEDTDTLIRANGGTYLGGNYFLRT